MISLMIQAIKQVIAFILLPLRTKVGVSLDISPEVK